MSLQGLPNEFAISEEDWKQTPPAVQALVLQQPELIRQLIRRLEEHLDPPSDFVGKQIVMPFLLPCKTASKSIHVSL
jgi:hypothetical protein